MRNPIAYGTLMIPEPVPYGERCQYCNEPSPHRTKLCGSIECRRHHQRYRQAMDQSYRQERLSAICYALAQWCRYEGNYRVTWLRRIAFTIKALICLACDWQDHCYCAYPGPDGYTVAIWGQYSPADYEYGGVGWTGLAVAMPWNVWGYEVFQDTSV